MMLEPYIRQRLKDKRLLVMSHIVIGYPTFRESWALARAMVDAGVDLMELQIPFSEPMADGPVILQANQRSLEGGSTLAKCFEFTRELASQLPIPLLFMSYYNILFKYGLERFARDAKEAGVVGAIVPDLPLEESLELHGAFAGAKLDPVLLFAPNTPEERLAAIAARGSGMIYCVARKGVTGAKTEFSVDLEQYLKRARAATELPLGVGFGIKDPADVDFLKGKADIAIVGSECIKLFDRSGVRAVGDFMRTLTAAARG